MKTMRIDRASLAGTPHERVVVRPDGARHTLEQTLVAADEQTDSALDCVILAVAVSKDGIPVVFTTVPVDERFKRDIRRAIDLFFGD